MHQWKLNSLSAPLYIHWELTSRCLNNCLYCYNCSGPDAGQDDLTDEQVLDVARQLVQARVAKVVFSGGEPLCRGDLLWEASQILVDGGVHLTLLTDGSLLDDEAAARISRLFKLVVLALDGPGPDIHDNLRGRSGSFADALGALQRLGAGGVPTHAYCTVTSFNVDAMADTAETVAGVDGVNQLFACTLVDSGRAIGSDLALSLTGRQKFTERFVDIKLQFKGRLQLEISDPTRALKNLVMVKPPNAFMVIRADGSVAASPWLPLIGDSVRHVSLVDAWRPLAGVWSDDRVQQLLSRMTNVNRLGFSHRRYIDPPLHINELPDPQGGDRA